MPKDPVTPFRSSHRSKEARLARMRERFEQAHPVRLHQRKRAGSPRTLLLLIAIALLMIWLASSLAGVL